MQDSPEETPGKDQPESESSTTEETERISAEAKAKIDQITDDFDQRLNDLSSRAEQAASTYRNKQSKVANERKSEGESARGLGYGLTYAYVLIGTPIVGFGVGYLIDNAAGTTNWKNYLAVAGTIFGFVAMLVLIKRDSDRNP